MSDKWLEIPADAPHGIVVDDPKWDEHVLPLATVMPQGFDLQVLLQFLPDVAIKRQIEYLAAELRAVQVTGAAGIAAAETKLVELRRALDYKDECFAEPCTLANALHKRLTGLRADFGADGHTAVLDATNKIKAEKRRLDQFAEAERRRQQEEADRLVREQLAQQAKDLKASGAAPEVVREVRKAAKVAVAPRVEAPVLAPLSTSTLAKNIKARLVGTPDDAEPNPPLAAMSPTQQAQVRAICAKVATGDYPLAVLAGLDWSYLNARIKREGTALGISEIEPVDVGSLRRGRR